MARMTTALLAAAVSISSVSACEVQPPQANQATVDFIASKESFEPDVCE